jgi:hypothetical protein
VLSAAVALGGVSRHSRVYRARKGGQWQSSAQHL